MRTILYIAVIGKKGAGKSTLAKRLEQEAFCARRVSFAGRLKNGLAAMLGVKRALLDDPEFKASTCPITGQTYRHMMQTLGTEWGRQMIDQDIWVKLLAEDIHRDTLKKTFIADDVRFPNEITQLIEELKKYDPDYNVKVVTIKVSRRLPSDETDGHDSEKALKSWTPDILFRNQGLEPKDFKKNFDVWTKFGRDRKKVEALLNFNLKEL